MIYLIMAHLFLCFSASTANLEFVNDAIGCGKSSGDAVENSKTSNSSSSSTSTSTYLDSVLECHQIYSDKQCCYHQDDGMYYQPDRISLSDDGSIESDYDEVSIESPNEKEVMTISNSKRAMKEKSSLQKDDDETIHSGRYYQAN